jgi:hypothetical protein
MTEQPIDPDKIERDAQELQRQLARRAKGMVALGRCACNREAHFLIGPPGALPSACTPVCARCATNRVVGGT